MLQSWQVKELNYIVKLYECQLNELTSMCQVFFGMPFFGITYNSEGNKLFGHFKDNHFIVFDDSENIICDATFDENGIIDGKAKIFYEKGFLEFEGLFLSGKRCGGVSNIYPMGERGKRENGKLIS